MKSPSRAAPVRALLRALLVVAGLLGAASQGRAADELEGRPLPREATPSPPPDELDRRPAEPEGEVSPLFDEREFERIQQRRAEELARDADVAVALRRRELTWRERRLGTTTFNIWSDW